MNALWWLALPVLLLPIWWHRQKRRRVKAQPLATARFLPRAEPQQLRVWRWVDRALLLARCLLLACLIAWLADLALPWRGDTVLVAAGADRAPRGNHVAYAGAGSAWMEKQIADAGFAGARRIDLDTPDAVGWLRQHENEWQPGARLLLLGSLPMPAVLPRFRHRVELRSKPAPFPAAERHVAIVSERAGQWRTLFAALDGPHRYMVAPAPGANTELIVWDRPEAPPPNLHAPLWWIGDATAFPELRNGAVVDGLRYADSPRGRLWAVAALPRDAVGASALPQVDTASPPRDVAGTPALPRADAAWPPHNVDSARALFETWQRLHYPPVPYTAPSQVLAAKPDAPSVAGGGALRDILMMALIALFALERILAHANRR